MMREIEKIGVRKKGIGRERDGNREGDMCVEKREGKDKYR